MKLDITKTNIKYNNYLGLTFEIQFLKDIKEVHSCFGLLNPLTCALGKVINENDAIRNRITEFWQATHFCQPKTQKTNQPWITEDSWEQLYFILYIQWKKTVKYITSWRETLPASALNVNNFQDDA